MAEGQIQFIDRITGQRRIETVLGESSLRLLYGQSPASCWLGMPLRHLVSRFAIFSRLMGRYQNLGCTRRNIGPFCLTHDIDPSEFAKKIEDFTSFGDFFCRKLKPEARPITAGNSIAVVPTDGRFYFFGDVSTIKPFDIKGRTFDIGKLLQDETLAGRYARGSMVLGRLCPSDYHRFHFPIDCVPSASRLINGFLYSVNPIAVRQNISILWENKRIVTTLHSETFGEVICVEIGATSVGTIKQTFQPGKAYNKGDEKGYFAFGGSAMVLLFPQGSIRFDEDLLAATNQDIEIRCLLGQSMGRGERSQKPEARSQNAETCG